MTDKRNYRVSGKKLLPKPYNLRRNQAKKLGQSFSRLENVLRTRMRSDSRAMK